MTTKPVLETRVTRSYFGDNYTDGLIVHAISKGLVVSPSQKATNTIKHSIDNSTVTITIFTIVKKNNA